MLRTKCIRVERAPADGLRISVMNRHTLEDGENPDPEITPESYKEWWPSLGPPSKLIGDYLHRGMPWEEYAERFNDHLNNEVARAAADRLAQSAMVCNVTIMCIEDTSEHCHRRLVAERCQLILPELEVVLA